MFNRYNHPLLLVDSNDTALSMTVDIVMKIPGHLHLRLPFSSLWESFIARLLQSLSVFWQIRNTHGEHLYRR